VSDLLHELREWLLKEHSGTVDADRLTVIQSALEGLVSAGVPGAVVELGCYRGAMALWMRAVLDSAGDPDREIHVYDSFQGLPSPGMHDHGQLPMGPLVASVDNVVDTHVLQGRPVPTIHPGWFADTLPTRLPAQVAFAYLDGDFYDSILASLIHCVPRLANGALLVVDDYADPVANPRAWGGAPGVKKACDAYFGTPSPIRVVVGEEDLALGVYRHWWDGC